MKLLERNPHKQSPTQTAQNGDLRDKLLAPTGVLSFFLMLAFLVASGCATCHRGWEPQYPLPEKQQEEAAPDGFLGFLQQIIYAFFEGEQEMGR